MASKEVPGNMPMPPPMMGGMDPTLLGFAQATEKNEISDIMKELFDEGKIFMITDVTKDEAKLMTRVYMVAKMKGLERWGEGLQFFAKILLSRKRQSRLESLKAIGGWISGKRFIDRLRGGMRGGERW